MAISGVVCDSSLFSLEIAVSKKLLTSDGARTNSSVSLIKQVAFVGQQHEAFGLQGAGLLMLRMSVKLTHVTRVVLPNTLKQISEPDCRLYRKPVAGLFAENANINTRLWIVRYPAVKTVSPQGGACQHAESDILREKLAVKSVGHSGRLWKSPYTNAAAWTGHNHRAVDDSPSFWRVCQLNSVLMSNSALRVSVLWRSCARDRVYSTYRHHFIAIRLRACDWGEEFWFWNGRALEGLKRHPCSRPHSVRKWKIIPPPRQR